MDGFEKYLIDEKLRLIEKPYVTANFRGLSSEPTALDKLRPDLFLVLVEDDEEQEPLPNKQD